MVAHVVISDELLRLEVRFKTASCQVHFLDSLNLSRERRVFVPIYAGGILNPRSHFTGKVHRSTWVCKHDLLRFTSFLCLLHFAFYSSLCLDLPVESFEGLFASVSFIDILQLSPKFPFHLGFIFLNLLVFSIQVLELLLNLLVKVSNSDVWVFCVHTSCHLCPLLLHDSFLDLLRSTKKTHRMLRFCVFDILHEIISQKLIFHAFNLAYTHLHSMFCVLLFLVLFRQLWFYVG